MKGLFIFISFFILTTDLEAADQSFFQLSDSAGAQAAPAPVPPPAAAPEAVDTGLPPAGVDFLVRPDAEHEPGARLFTPWSMVEKSGGGTPKIPYLEIARAEASAQGVSLSLVLAIIQKESSFDPKARSSVGARGLMQLMPETARNMGLKDTSRLTQPAVNIKYGVKYIKYLWGQFAAMGAEDISVADMGQKASQMAIAAYNAGQGNVRKYNDIPPFKETRNYVVKVTQYFKYYDELLAGPTPPR